MRKLKSYFPRAHASSRCSSRYIYTLLYFVAFLRSLSEEMSYNCTFIGYICTFIRYNCTLLDTPTTNQRRAERYAPRGAVCVGRIP